MNNKKYRSPLVFAPFCSWLKDIIVNTWNRVQNLTYCDVGYEVGCGISDLLGKYNPEDIGRAENEFKKSNVNLRDWCCRWIPDVLNYIPYSKRTKFFRGMKQAYQDGEVQFEYQILRL